MMTNARFAGLVVCGLALIGCNKKTESTNIDSTSRESATAAPAAGANSEASLVAAATPGPDGYQWERMAQGSLCTLEVPSGEGWKKEPNEVSNETLDITVMLQEQSGVDVTDRSEYVQSFIDVNKRDAPKYEVVERQDGQVKGQVAARVDGKFDNGTAYATRDYVLFVKGAVLSVMVRGPSARQAETRSIADRIAASLK